MERRGQVAVQLDPGFANLDSRSNSEEQQLASSQAEMGLFPCHWGSAKEGKRQKCESQLGRIQSSIQQQSVRGYALLLAPHGTEEKNHSEQQQQHMLHNDKLLELESHEHLFYKVVTPSDVGKLNRLVIPKQHAERYFPLDPSLRKKGRLLSFQDVVSRELWWFRYSYWSSSQSYVLTKGWIRFVKDKELQAGDIISFERGARHELYINCRKRPTTSSSSSSRGFIVPYDDDDPPARTMRQLQLRYPDLGAMQLAPSSSEEDGDEEATAQGTRLFGVDLRAKPVQNSDH